MRAMRLPLGRGVGHLARLFRPNAQRESIKWAAEAALASFMTAPLVILSRPYSFSSMLRRAVLRVRRRPPRWKPS